MALNRVVNNPDLVVDDMLVGWLGAHRSSVGVVPSNPRVVQRHAAPELGKVGVVTGGGSGHEPAFLGYVGDGLLDAVAVGEIFSSPTARSFLDAIRAANGGAGVACLFGNYAGDNMNVKLAVEMAAREGITVQIVTANDDVASAPRGEEAKRRGVAGEILMWKVGAASAAMGADLDEVIAVSRRAIANTRSIGVGLSACVIPAVGKANFAIEPGTMEVGIGHHGEPGIAVHATLGAAAMAELMLEAVMPDLPFAAGDRVAVLVSGLGATPLMEQYILYAEVEQRLEARGMTVAFSRVGNLFTSLEMMGVTLTVMKLDPQLEACLGHPCSSPALTVVGSTPAGRAYSNAIASVAAPEAGVIQIASPRVVTGAALPLSQAGGCVRDLIDAVIANREYLSEIDGLIGDGDHGVNMAKGFGQCAVRLDALGAKADALAAAFDQLSQALRDDIGGSMGPLYGSLFGELAATLAPHPQLDAVLFEEALAAGVLGVQGMGGAAVGDKTLIDTLVPALGAYREARAAGGDFTAALRAMSDGAAAGRDSTRQLQAKVGRAARLGPRSIGVLDAGATSCCLILQTLAASLQGRLTRMEPHRPG
jgi:dihydroxyacetone kinase